MRSSLRLKGTNLARETNVAPLADREAAEGFSHVVRVYSVGQLAEAGNRTKETAKGWKKARQMASGASLINLAAKLPSVEFWVQGEIAKRRGVDTAPNLAQMIAALQTIATFPGEEGAEARAILKRIMQLTMSGDAG